MKKVMVFLVIVLAMVLVSAVSAQPSTYDSGFQVANLSGSDANIVISYVNKDGSTDATVNGTIPANGSVTYFPIGASAGFDGSVVISSNQPVAAIANVLGDGFAFGASYESFDSGASSVSLPLIMKDNFGFDTWFNVQNASAPGGADVDVTVSFAGQSCDKTETIPAGAAFTFDQGADSCLPAGYVGAATISATGDIVATVMQTGPATLFAYNGFTGGSSSPIMPLVQANNFGFSTGIQIQNTGGSSTDVTVSYAAGSAGADCTEMKTIAAGASETFALGSTCTALGGPQFVGGASVTANSASQDLVAIVNQLNFTSNDKGAAYNAFAPSAATGSVNFPLIMQDNFGFFTGFNVYNAGGSDADVTCTFSAGANKPADITTTIAPATAYTAVQLGSGQYVGSVTCTAAGGSLVGVANELGSGAGDNFFAYGGFNQ
ncbi:MAG: hypothetical protein KC425_08165 [Anaerolineales bacterium]|nr:hypothetical protein [Anaerolineales bacterium]